MAWSLYMDLFMVVSLVKCPGTNWAKIFHRAAEGGFWGDKEWCLKFRACETLSASHAWGPAWDPQCTACSPSRWLTWKRVPHLEVSFPERSCVPTFEISWVRLHRICHFFFERPINSLEYQGNNWDIFINCSWYHSTVSWGSTIESHQVTSKVLFVSRLNAVLKSYEEVFNILCSLGLKREFILLKTVQARASCGDLSLRLQLLGSRVQGHSQPSSEFKTSLGLLATLFQKLNKQVHK